MALTPAEKKRMEELRGLIAQEESLLSAQPATPIEEPQAVVPEGPGGFRGAMQTLLPGGMAAAESVEPDEDRDIKIELETLQTRLGVPGRQPEEVEADKSRQAELQDILFQKSAGSGAGQIGKAVGEIGKTALTAAGDVLGLPARALSAIKNAVSAEEGQKLDAAVKTMQDVEAGIFKGSRQESNAFYNDLIAETENPILKGALTGIKFLAEASISVIEDPATLVSGVVKTVSKFPKALKGAEAGVEAITKGPGAATAGLSSQLTGVSAEALQEAGLGIGKKAKALREASPEKAGSFNIGEDIVEKINNFDELIPEASKITDALKAMPDIPTERIIKTLESSLVKNAVTDAATNSNAAIQRSIDNLKEVGETLTAESFRRLRVQFDEGIEFGKPGFDAVEASFSKARKAMAQDLILAAKKSGNEGFESTMKTFAKKLQARDKLSKLLGKNKASQSLRAETFTNTLFGKGKTARQGLVKQFDDIFGTGFFEKIRTSKLSAELGPKGVPTLLPKQGGSRVIGAGVLGGTLAPVTLPAVAALASPKVSSKIVGLFDLIGAGTFKASKGLAKLSVKNEVIAAEAFNAIIKALPKSETERLADLMDKRGKSKNKKNIDKRINSILEKGL